MFLSAVVVALVIVLGLMAWIRLAPAEAAAWHQWPGDVPAAVRSGSGVTPVTGGAWARLPLSKGQPKDVLARLNAIALATPRTSVFAGSVEEGRITWVTRSLFWGFPDYTTAQIEADGLTIHARLRFGRNDFGVNAARLRDWLARL